MELNMAIRVWEMRLKSEWLFRQMNYYTLGRRLTAYAT
jgi:hypothetical protein